MNASNFSNYPTFNGHVYIKRIQLKLTNSICCPLHFYIDGKTIWVGDSDNYTMQDIEQMVL